MMDFFSTSQHGPLNWTPSEIYGDLRKFREFEGPSRLVRLPQVTPSGGAFAYSTQYDKTVVVGRETLRFLKVADQPSSVTPGDDTSAVTLNGSRSPHSAVGPGGTRASAGPNFWTSKLRATHLMTDVAWGPSQFSDRVFTSCSNGEIMSWNMSAGALRFDVSLPGGARSVNIINSATLSSYSIATGSTDGSIKLWDLRHPRSAAFSLSSHGSAVRSLTFGRAEIAPMHVVFGLENGMIFRYDLRMRIEYLDRVVAHDTCVHDLAWLSPSQDDTCAGYLASGSFDHTVKIWQIDLARLSTKPLHTLHAPYPIGKLGWRPDFATEVVVLPYHSGGGQRAMHGNGTADTSASDSVEKFAPRIWDIRKGWVAKWAIGAADGPATDLSVHSPDTIHVLYKSGAFMQHDLREATRPPDLMPRHALSWNADDTLFYVADKPRKWDPPYDDLHPAVAPLLPDYGLLDKHPGDRLGISTTQIIGTERISTPSPQPHSNGEERSHTSVDKMRQRFMELARGYRHHDADRVRMCEINQAVATKAGDIGAAQTWSLLATLLRDLTKPQETSTAYQVPPLSMPAAVGSKANPATPGSTGEKAKAQDPQSATRPRPKTPPGVANIKGESTRIDAPTSKRKHSGGSGTLFVAPGVHNSKRRDSSPSLLSHLRPTTRSPSSSPAMRGVKLPNTMLASMSYNPASTVARQPFNRRVSISSAGNSKSNSPGPTSEEKKPGWTGGGFAAVASGALEESSSDEEDDEDDEFSPDGAIGQSDASIDSAWAREKRTVATLGAGVQHPTLHSSSSSSHSSPANGGKTLLPPSHLVSNKAALLSNSNSRMSSPYINSQLLDTQHVNENDGDESDGIDEDDASGTSDSAKRRNGSRSSSGSRGSDSRRVDVPSDSQTKFSPPSPTLAKFMAKSTDSSRTATISRAGLRVMTRQGSDSSATVNPVGSLGITGSFGSSIMTPTIGRMSVLGAWSKKEEEMSKPTDIHDIASDSRSGTAAMRISPAGKSLPLRDMFSAVSNPNGQVSAIPTPTTAVSTQSGLKSALTNGSYGSRVIKGQNGTLMSSNPPLGSAGPEQEGFLFVFERNMGDETKWSFEHKEVVEEMEREERKAMFEVVRESLDAYAEEGNVQMCAALAMAAHEELGVDSERLERFTLAYLDQLMRMNLHLNAAYVRKEAPVPFISESTTTDGYFHTSCGTCGKLLAGVGPPETRGRHAFCQKCNRHATRCSICHLPVRGMLYFCHSCGHGGHQKCYYDFYRDQPPADLAAPPSKFLTAPYGHDDDEEEDEEEDSQGDHTSTHSHSRSVSADGSRPEEERRSEGGKSQAPRGRRRDIRRSASEMTDGHGHDTIPETQAVTYSGSAGASNHGAGTGGRKAQVDKRSTSTLKAEESTTLDEDRGIPDEEYLIVREREADEREAARADLQLFGHHCAAGCGHFCWMAKQ